MNPWSCSRPRERHQGAQRVGLVLSSVALSGCFVLYPMPRNQKIAWRPEHVDQIVRTHEKPAGRQARLEAYADVALQGTINVRAETVQYCTKTRSETVQRTTTTKWEDGTGGAVAVDWILGASGAVLLGTGLFFGTRSDEGFTKSQDGESARVGDLTTAGWLTAAGGALVLFLPFAIYDSVVLMDSTSTETFDRDHPPETKACERTVANGARVDLGSASGPWLAGRTDAAGLLSIPITAVPDLQDEPKRQLLVNGRKFATIDLSDIAEKLRAAAEARTTARSECLDQCEKQWNTNACETVADVDTALRMLCAQLAAAGLDSARETAARSCAGQYYQSRRSALERCDVVAPDAANLDPASVAEARKACLRECPKLAKQQRDLEHKLAAEAEHVAREEARRRQAREQKRRQYPFCSRGERELCCKNAAGAKCMATFIVHSRKPLSYEEAARVCGCVVDP
jgi:hypothetical protein